MDEAVWNHAVFSKNRERLLNERSRRGFFQRVLERAKPHIRRTFHVDGTLIEAWASQKSFRRKDGKGNPPGAEERSIFMGKSRRTRRMNRRRTRCPAVQESKRQRGRGLPGHVLMRTATGFWCKLF